MGQILEYFRPKITTNSQERYVFPEQEDPEKALAWIKARAGELREIWWSITRPDPTYDVGLLLLTDPTPSTKSVEFELIRLEEWREFLCKHGRDTAGIDGEAAAFKEFLQAHSIEIQERILEVHLPPRPQLTKTDWSELPAKLLEFKGSLAGLAGWAAAYNEYAKLRQEPTMGIISCYQFSLVGEKAVRRWTGFPFVIESSIPKSLYERHDLIWRLIADPDAPLKKLVTKPLLTALTTPKILQNIFDVETKKDEAGIKVEVLIAGRTIELPCAGNNWTMSVRSDESSPKRDESFPELAAQLLRGIIQIAVREGFKARRDVKIAILDDKALSPYIPNEKHRGLEFRNLRPWDDVFPYLGKEIVSFGIPPIEIISAFLQPPLPAQR